jgi:hypothetical protein
VAALVLDDFADQARFDIARGVTGVLHLRRELTAFVRRRPLRLLRRRLGLGRLTVV